MQEQFVTYEIALKLKELGFDEPCLAYYAGETLLSEFVLDYSKTVFYTQTNNGYEMSAPLWQQAWPFLDDNGVIIDIIFVDNVFKYTLNIENYVSNGFKNRMSAIKSATEHATSYLWDKKHNYQK